MASVTGWRVRTWRSLSARITSRPQSTPSCPSYLPPVGTESTCEPIITGGRGAVPARSPKMLPIWSTVTRRAASRIHATTRSRARLSSSLRASRVSPPRGVSPILPSSSMDVWRRLRSIFMRPTSIYHIPGRRRSHSQIGALEPLVAQQVAGGAGQDQASGFQHAGAVGEGEGLAHVLLDQEHRHAVGVDRPHRLEDLADGVTVLLVEQNVR